MAKDINEKDAPVGVQSVTESMPAEADKESIPNAMDAESEHPPVRAAKPDTPIAQVLAAGAGRHQPPDPDEYDVFGRPVSVSGGPSVNEARADAEAASQPEPSSSGKASK